MEQNNITFVIRFFKDWSPEIKRQLRNLTINHNKFGTSCMRYEIQQKANLILTCVAFNKDKVIGWAMYLKYSFSIGKKDSIMVYVKKPFRRMGIGRRLVNKLKNKEIKGYSYNDSSCKFWTHMRKNYKNVIHYKWGEY